MAGPGDTPAPAAALAVGQRVAVIDPTGSYRFGVVRRPWYPDGLRVTVDCGARWVCCHHGDVVTAGRVLFDATDDVQVEFPAAVLRELYGSAYWAVHWDWKAEGLRWRKDHPLYRAMGRRGILAAYEGDECRVEFVARAYRFTRGKALFYRYRRPPARANSAAGSDKKTL
jgi:hypothetical protein